MTDIPKIYLIPVELGDTPTDKVIPSYNIDVIRRLRHFIVENVRSARRFLKRCDRSIDIDSLTFTELNEHTRPEDFAALLAPADAGNDMGIISEAGCPAIADPGADVVAIAQRKGYKVVPLVGPSSILMSLMGSGFNGQSFAFSGYLPIDGGSRSAKLKEMERRIRQESQTQIFIETPYRNNKLIAELARTLPGSLMLCVASDITGERESILTRPLSQWARASYDYDKIPTIFLLYK
jgi:16S rRNA (cytidine1402-2'-O)-methyltransferase